MKVLDLNQMSSYAFMQTSLSALTRGDLRGALSSALRELRVCHSVTERIDLSLYIAKIYSEMGEFKACSTMLFGLFRYKRDEGRIYALLSYNFYRCGDAENGLYYNTLMQDWNAREGNILDIRLYSVARLNKSDRGIKRDFERHPVAERAWKYALDGDTKRARTLIMTLGSEHNFDKYELLVALDIVDDCHSMETSRILREILSADIDTDTLMRLIYTLERTGNIDAIVSLSEKAIAENKCTYRIAEIYAIALLNTGRHEHALKILERLDEFFGEVFPRARSLIYTITERCDIFVPIYHTRTDISDYALARDELILRDIRGRDVEDIMKNCNIMSMIHDMYSDGIVTECTERVTRLLSRSQQGRDYLLDLLLDIGVDSALMRVHIVKNIVRYTRLVPMVYSNIYHEAKYTPPPMTLSDEKLKKYNETYAYMMISGEV